MFRHLNVFGISGISFFAVALSLTAAQAMAQTLPSVPADIKAAGVLRVGVRCDQPPYGYQNDNGDHVGVEVDMARQIANWIFGSPEKVALTCVSAENRIPQLLGHKVDLLIATLGISPERARVIDFTDSYRWGASDVMVKTDGGIAHLAQLKGKTVAVLKGSVQAKWFEDKMPDVKTLRLNSAADATQAFNQGRAEAYSHDAATLIVVAAHQKGVKLIGEPFQVSDAAIGIRKNETAWRDYLNAAIVKMRQDGDYTAWVQKDVPADIRSYYLDAFTKPRPKETVQ